MGNLIVVRIRRRFKRNDVVRFEHGLSENSLYAGDTTTVEMATSAYIDFSALIYLLL